jgi:hypothetical protein
MTTGGPILLAHSILDDGTVTASTTASGHHAENMKDRMLFTKWRSDGSATQVIDIDMGAGNTAACTALAMSGHNFRSQTVGGMTVYQSADGSSYTAVGAISPAWLTAATNDRTFMFHWGTAGGSGGSAYTVSANRYWRVTMNGCDAAIEIGALALGVAVEFPEYMALGYDPLSLSLKSKQARSRDGSFLGSVVEHVSQRIELKFSDNGLVSTSFFGATGDGSWDQFLRTVWSHGKPFWFSPTLGYDGTVGSFGNGHYCFPSASEKHGSGYITGTQRNLKFGFDTLCEGMSA